MTTTDYLQFFGLDDDPSRLTPDPTYFFPSREHNEILASLYYAIEQKEGFSVIVGEPGTGKTTILRILLDRWKDKADIALILTPRLSPEEFLQAVLEDIHVQSGGTNKNEMLKAFRDILIEHSSTGKRVIIIVDEAQNLPDETLEELRILSNLETEKEKLLQIILLGQPELKRRLQADNLKQLNQRVTIRATLKPLSEDETSDYIHFRLIKAGKGNVIFDGEAQKRIYRISGGIPRLINLVCSRSIMAAFVSGSSTIKKNHVGYAIEHLSDEKPSSRNLIYAACILLAMIVVAGVVFSSKWLNRSAVNDVERLQMKTNMMQKMPAVKRGLLFGGNNDITAVRPVVIVVADKANIRNGPSIAADKVARVSKGTALEVLDESADESGWVWYRVRLSDGRENYWISRAVVK